LSGIYSYSLWIPDFVGVTGLDTLNCRNNEEILCYRQFPEQREFFTKPPIPVKEFFRMIFIPIGKYIHIDFCISLF